MNAISETDLAAFDAIDEDRALANALAAPDASPKGNGRKICIANYGRQVLARAFP